MYRTLPFDKFAIGLFELAADAVFYLVLLLVDVAVFLASSPKFLGGCFVMRVGRADEVEVRIEV